eukprot:TRINITY_DN24903_c0_g1_i1.p1 TRINITY_DN24903_c0_g1~~TRINITY_DN24903_c0_g1_i1.p1  ORF type:complete len:392 (-),score=74.20 TRINITY_DN24903_c0_g1_i1:128-1303(-)
MLGRGKACCSSSSTCPCSFASICQDYACISTRMNLNSIPLWLVLCLYLVAVVSDATEIMVASGDSSPSSASVARANAPHFARSADDMQMTALLAAPRTVSWDAPLAVADFVMPEAMLLQHAKTEKKAVSRLMRRELASSPPVVNSDDDKDDFATEDEEDTSEKVSSKKGMGDAFTGNQRERKANEAEAKRLEKMLQATPAPTKPGPGGRRRGGPAPGRGDRFLVLSGTDVHWNVGKPEIEAVPTGCMVTWIASDSDSSLSFCMTYEHSRPKFKVFFSECNGKDNQKWKLENGCLRLSKMDWCLAADKKQAWLSKRQKSMFFDIFKSRTGNYMRLKSGGPPPSRDRNAVNTKDTRTWSTECVELNRGDTTHRGARLKKCMSGDDQYFEWQCR